MRLYGPGAFDPGLQAGSWPYARKMDQLHQGADGVAKLLIRATNRPPLNFKGNFCRMSLSQVVRHLRHDLRQGEP